VFEAYNVPLNDKEGEEPTKYDHFDETFLGMCQLKIENEIWWLGTGINRRWDDENEDVPAENTEKETEGRDLGSGEKYFNAEDDERSTDEKETAPEVIVPTLAAQISVQQKKKTVSSGVDPLRRSGSIPDSDFMRIQAELDHARVENTRFQALLQQTTPQPKP
ncbi:hypothetical protein Dimus_011168, partial [Dionaea muscipula]